MKRVVILGTTGAGKTTLAKRLAGLLGCPHVELDSLFWLANWKPVPDGEFRERVKAALAGESWVVDGNCTSKARDLVWARADTIVWLDYSLPTVMWRLVQRTVRRVVTQEQLWNGNRESMRDQLLTRESLFLWALQTHPKHRRTYPKLFAEALRPNQNIVHLHAPREADQWIRSLTEMPQDA